MEVMIEKTGEGTSYKSINSTLNHNISKEHKVPTSVDEFIKTLNNNNDLVNDKWVGIKVDSKNILIVCKNGIERIKDCELLGIDGNHKSEPELQGNKEIWDQLVSFVAVYVHIPLFM